jgi:hypothetical protein
MSNLRVAKFTHFLAEFMKSVQASESTFRGRPFDIIYFQLSLLYSEIYDIFRGLATVFLTFKFA